MAGARPVRVDGETGGAAGILASSGLLLLLLLVLLLLLLLVLLLLLLLLLVLMMLLLTEEGRCGHGGGYHHGHLSVSRRQSHHHLSGRSPRELHEPGGRLLQGGARRQSLLVPGARLPGVHDGRGQEGLPGGVDGGDAVRGASGGLAHLAAESVKTEKLD